MNKNNIKFCTMGIVAVGVASLMPTAMIPVGIGAGLALALILIEKGYTAYKGDEKVDMHNLPLEISIKKVNDPSKVMSSIGSIREESSEDLKKSPEFKIGK